MILAQAAHFGGWSLYLQDGKPAYTYNWLGLHQYTVGASEALPAGKATIRYEFTYEGGGMGKGGKGTLFVNGKSVATGKIDQTQYCFFGGRRRQRGCGRGDGGTIPQGSRFAEGAIRLTYYRVR